ncbi:MAG: RNA 2',3'-cyclic phosphodiesterase [Porticoccaceae bacterium]
MSPVPAGYRRLFIALPVPAGSGKRLNPHCDSSLEIRWIEATNRHLTLAFLGHRTEEQTIRAIEVVNGLVAPPFELQLVCLQRFPDERGRNIVAIPAPCEPLMELQQQVANLLTERGFTLKQRDFRPHITLGKFNRGQWSSINLNPPITMSVASVTLFQTEFIPNGILYHPLTSQQLV